MGRKRKEKLLDNIYSYNKGLLTALSNTEFINLEEISIKNKNLENFLDKRKIVKYFYKQIEDNNISFKYIIPFPNEFLVALYIYIIKSPRSFY